LFINIFGSIGKYSYAFLLFTVKSVDNMLFNRNKMQLTAIKFIVILMFANLAWINLVLVN